MKKLISLFAIVLMASVAFSQSSTPRFGLPPKNDNTGRVLTYIYKTPTSALTYTITPNASKTIVKMSTLDTTLNVTAKVGLSQFCDELVFIFTSDATSRTVTFSGGLVPSATMAVDASQKATVSFIFDGTAFIETGRAKQ